MTDFGFEARAEDAPDDKFTPVPAGWYTAQAEKAESKPFKSGSGEAVNVQWRILGPLHQNRVVFGRVTTRSTNETAQKIGREQLAQLAAASGKGVLRNTDQIVGITCEIRLKVTKSEEFGDGNDVVGYRAAGGAMPTVTKQAAPVASGSPWSRAAGK